ncbi:MAG: VWA domain-containing protein [Flavobacteriales bacterium]
MRPDRDRWLALFWIAIAAVGVGLATVYLSRTYEIAKPIMLWALVLVALIALVYFIRQGERAPLVKLPTLGALLHGPVDLLAPLRSAAFAAGLAGLALLVLAMARPQSSDSWKDEKREGIDIVIALDISASMLAKDLRPDRLEASKEVAKDFIDGRPNDRIGLVVYEGEAFTQCPLTTDHRVLKDLFDNATSGLINGGTAVGMGLATALNRLRESESKSKVVILLTDGVTNAGSVQPLDAAQIAEQLGIRVYTIGVGTRGKALSPVARYADGRYRYDYVDVDLDEQTLQSIADLTGGKYFRATDTKKLKEIYSEIDRMEKTRIKVTEHSLRTEEYFPFAWIGAALLALSFLMDRTFLRGMV